MDVHGAMVSEVQLAAGVTSMAWSAEKFTMEEDERPQKGTSRVGNLGTILAEDRGEKVALMHSCACTSTDDRNYVLAVCLADGNIVMLRSFDDVSPITIRSNLRPPLHAEWSNSRKLLAIAGTRESEGSQSGPHEYTNLLKFYSVNGSLVYTTEIPYTQVRRKHALCRPLSPLLRRRMIYLAIFSAHDPAVPRIGVDMGSQRQAALRGDRRSRSRRMGFQVISLA